MAKEEWIGDLWPRQLREEMQRRLDHARSVAEHATRPDFKEAVEHMVRLHEGIMTAIVMDGHVPSAFVVMAADRLAGEVCKLVDDDVHDARSAVGDALLDYAATRHEGGDVIGKVRETFNDLPTTKEGRKFDATTTGLAHRDERIDQMIQGIINTTYHGDNWHADLRDDIWKIVHAARDTSAGRPVSVDAETPL